MSSHKDGMTHQQRNDEINDTQFQEVLDAVRNTEPTEEEMSAAAYRVWKKVEAARASAASMSQAEGEDSHVLRSRADYERLFPAYYDNTLPEALEELLEARLREDVDTRRSWQQYKAQRTRSTIAAPVSPVATKKSWMARFSLRWVTVAAMVPLAAAISWYSWNSWGPAQRGPQGTVHASSGHLYVVRGAEVATLTAGANIMPGDQIRVPEGGSAVVALRDGSLAELRAGSSFQLRSFGNDLTLQLLGGDVIVEAAKRSRGHLYVDSRELRVAVTGTVFAVGAGAHGSRVAVVEGSVLVAQNGKKRSLRPGQQYASDGRMTPVPVERQIAWSSNVEKHLALLRSLTELQTELENVQLPSLRYGSKLASHVPQNAVVFISLPNLENAIGQAREIINDRLQQDPTLKEWVQQSNSEEFTIDQLLSELEGMSSYLGDELLVVSVLDAKGKPGAPVLAAELRKDGFEEHLRQRLAALHRGPEAPELHVYHDLVSLHGANIQDGLAIVMSNGKLVLSPDVASLRAAAAALLSDSPSGFLEGGLGTRVSEAYREGAGVFVAADTATLMANKGGVEDSPDNRLAGIHELQFVELKQRQVDGHPDLRTTLTFVENRKGVASWLAEPGALRAMEFITANAFAVSAAMVKDPVAMLADLLPVIANKEGDALTEVERKLNINIREDLAAPLGNEVAIAIDGPLVPVPSWKVVVQVNDPVRFRTTLERLVEAYNREVSLHGKERASLSVEAIDGMEFHTLTFPEAGPFGVVHYVFSQGYLVMAPDRGLLRQSLQAQASGTSVLSNATFRELIPAGASTGFSAVFFQQAGESISSMATELSRIASEDPERAAAIEQVMRGLQPNLVAAYAEPKSITIASRDSLIGLGGGSVLRLGFLAHTLDALKKN
jgi:hypothetical protein